jgi:hypothetical protein
MFGMRPSPSTRRSILISTGEGVAAVHTLIVSVSVKSRFPWRGRYELPLETTVANHVCDERHDDRGECLGRATRSEMALARDFAARSAG